ncbi:hypothetical protein TL16_g06352 [Triparma laevis f. inornata]|uniref:Mitochondrial carrier n=2 Tax=Triparma laevis TaxID=1534972 RepID=A0A9W7C7L5_9STRA|nr:hypothetical protein TL16_g06352 [Triparma laevis f. inornata]GMI04742.1 hypothetical protein TrLO_g13944 [Triparma laevis f. longispina]
MSYQPSPTSTILAGSVSGMLSTIAVYPLDVIRTHLQSQIASTGKLMTGTECFRSLLRQPYPEPPANSPKSIHSFHSLLSSTKLNFLPLYKGLLLPLSAQIIYKSTIFTLHSYLLRPSKMGLTIERFDPIVKSAIAGTLAGAVNALIWVTPVEYIRNNHIVNEGVSLNSFFQMWRGASLTVARDAIGCAAFFVARDLGKRKLPEPINNPMTHGMCAGLGFWLVALPFDTVKTLAQTNEGHNAKWVGRITNNPSLLFRGWQVAVCRGLPGAGITVWSYEKTLEWVESR